MGNTVSGSKDRHIDESVDFGSLSPQGVYTGPQDWNQQVVGHLIVDRKLAPFYRPLEEYEESWDDDRILAARKENPNAPPAPLPEPPASASSSSSKFHHSKHPNKAGKEPFRPTEASVYRGAVECPICFLYYPPNINRSRCCDQSICTECFVQIKRGEPTTTHLVSEPASCPYCVQDNFGVTYNPPAWRTGLMKEGLHAAATARPHMHKINSASSADSNGKRRKSFSADSPEVVTIDQIRPDWEAKLAAVRAAVTRRANRRIIMRQVGDRLVPIGVTSGRVIAEAGGEGASGAEGAEGGSGRRSRRRGHGHGGQDLNQLLGSVGLGGLGGQDLEELMVMEAMRLSLVEHEEQQRRQNNNGNTSNGENAQGTSANSNGNNASPASSASPSPRPSSSPSNRPTIPAPRPPSPIPSPSSTPPPQSPLRSRFPITPSPLSNTGNAAAISIALPGSAPPGATSHNTGAGAGTSSSLQPPAGRTHRRTGSNPGPPSGSTLAAALSAAQTATAFLNPGGAGRKAQRSAPATRAASPGPPEGERDVAATPVGRETSQTEPEATSVEPPTIIAHVPEAASEPATSSSTQVFSASPAPLAETSAPEVKTPSSEVDKETLSRDVEGYQPLLSSTETSAGDPLLDWDQ